jgi:hypothetical protein
MAMVDTLWLAALTKDLRDAGTDAQRLNLTINIDGEDVVDTHFYFSNLGRGQAELSGGLHGLPSVPLPSPIESTLLTHSSIRLGMRTDDAWAPRDVLVMGSTGRRIDALAMETEVESWLSTDRSEGKLTMPIRLVGQGSSSTPIRRVLFLVYTAWGDEDFGTNDPIELQIAAGGNLVLVQEIHEKLKSNTAKWFLFDALAPFTRGDVISNVCIRLAIQDDDAWLPKVLFLYGLDTSAGRPNEVVHLVSIPEWGFGPLSTNAQEGKSSIPLPVV